MPKAQHSSPQILSYSWGLSLVAVVLLAVAVIGILVWRLASERVLERTGEGLALAAADLADSLNRLLFVQARYAQMIAEAPILRGQDHEEIARYLRALQHTNQSYVWVGVTDVDGRVVAASDGSGAGFEVGGPAWFQSVRQAAGIHIRELAQTEGAASLFMAVPLHDHAGQFVGAIVLQMKLTGFTFVLDESLRSSRLVRQAGAAQEYRFLASDGTVFFDSSVRDLKRINLRHMGQPSAMLIPSGRAGYVEEMHIGRRVPIVTGYAQANGYANFPGLRWGITVSMDRADVVAAIHRDLRRVALWGALGCLAVATYLVWTLERLRRSWITTKEREGWFSSLLKSIDGGVIATDSQDRVVFLNRAAQSMTGWGSREACGKRLAEVLTIVQKPTSCCEVTPVAAASGKDGLCFSLGSEHLVTRDGSTLSVVSRAAPIEAPVGGSVVVCLREQPHESAKSDTRDRRSEDGNLDAALESTTDGLLVVNEQGHVTGLNQRLLSMWDIPGSVGESRTMSQILGLMKERLATPDALLRTISELDCQPDAESYDILELKDGRTIERFSRPKQEGDQFVGRVWTFHEVTASLTPAPL